MPGATSPTVADVVAAVGAPVLGIAQGGRGLETPVSDVSIVDHLDASTVASGAILLGVAVDAEGGHAVALIDRAAEVGAAAVALKAEGPLPARVLEPAADAGLAVLAVAPEMAWGQLYSLLRTALTGPAGTASGESSAGVAVGDLFSYADAVAAAVGAPVTIEDPQWRVLAYSNLDQAVDEPRRETILGRAPPAAWLERIEDAGVLRALRAGEELVRFRHPGLDSRVIAAIRAGDELLGSIWVLEGTTPLSEAAENELRRAAQRAGIHVLAHRSADDLERRRRASLVSDLLQGRGAADAALLAGGSELSAMAVAMAPDAADVDINPQRLVALVGLFAESADRRSTCAAIEGSIWALVPALPGRGRERLLELAQRIVGRAEHVLSLPLHVGIGEPVDRAARVPASGAGARRALAVLARRAPGRAAVAHIDDVRELATLIDLVDAVAARPDAAATKVGRLAMLDAERSGNYIATLRAWLDAHGDAARAADALGVHANTLRYRLRRLAELVGLDLDDADERLVIALELRALERDA